MASRLQAGFPDLNVALRVIKTVGDRQQTKSPGQFSSKGIFVKEIEDALLNREIDIAVHSVKDLPGELKAMEADNYVESKYRKELIPRLLQTVFYDLLTEETYEFVKKHKDPTINFKRLRQACIKTVKQHASDLF